MLYISFVVLCPRSDESLLFHVLELQNQHCHEVSVSTFNQVSSRLDSFDVSNKTAKQMASKHQYCRNAMYKFSPIIWRNYIEKKSDG